MNNFLVFVREGGGRSPPGRLGFAPVDIFPTKGDRENPSLENCVSNIPHKSLRTSPPCPVPKSTASQWKGNVRCFPRSTVCDLRESSAVPPPPPSLVPHISTTYLFSKQNETKRKLNDLRDEPAMNDPMGHDIYIPGRPERESK